MRHEIDRLAVLRKQIFHNRVVLMNVGRILVAGRNAVSGQNRSVHALCRIENRREDLLGIYTVHIGVMQQSLTLQHL